MARKPAPPPQREDRPTRRAAYLRVSTEDQAERATIEGQREKLLEWAKLHSTDFLAIYEDPGVSGTVPLAERPDGRRLVADAQAHRFDVVVVWKLDRLGRSLRVLLDAHDTLDSSGVAITSASEPFDTSNHIGRFLFSLLGSLAALERETILERTTMGRDRVARNGKWMGGPIPYGYTTSPEGHLVISPIEAAVVREIFQRIGDGSSCVTEARRLSALGISAERRYSQGKVYRPLTSLGPWSASTVRFMIRSTTYQGRYAYKTTLVECPAIVDPDLWSRANSQVTMNHHHPKGSRQEYLLSGRIKCQNCGLGYSGWTNKGVAYYRCNRQLSSYYHSVGDKCRSKVVQARWIEGVVWARIRWVVFHRTDALADAQKQLRERVSDLQAHEARRSDLRQAIAEKLREQDNQNTLFRKGRATEADTDRVFNQLEEELVVLRGELNKLDHQVQMAQITDAQYAEAHHTLEILAGSLEAMEQDGVAGMRQAVDALQAHVTLHTTGEGRRKHADAQVALALLPGVSDPLNTDAVHVNSPLSVPLYYISTYDTLGKTNTEG